MTHSIYFLPLSFDIDAEDFLIIRHALDDTQYDYTGVSGLNIRFPNIFVWKDDIKRILEERFIQTLRGEVNYNAG